MTGAAAPFVGRLSTAGIDPVRRIDWFEGEVASHMPGVGVRPLDRHGTFDFDWTFLGIGDVSMARIHMNNARCERTEREMRDGAEGLSLMLPLATPLRYRLDDSEHDIPLGHWGLMPQNRRTCGEMPPGGCLLVNLPYTPALAAALGRSGRAVLGDDPAVELFASYVRTLWTQGQRGAALPGLAARHMSELATAALDVSAPPAETLRDARRIARAARAREVVARRFAEPGLSMAAVAAEVGCSPRSIYAALEQEGVGFTALLMDARLEHARRALTARPFARILDIALDCGFADLSHFNRRFRQHYGATPRDWRATVLHAGTSVPAA